MLRQGQRRAALSCITVVQKIRRLRPTCWIASGGLTMLALFNDGECRKAATKPVDVVVKHSVKGHELYMYADAYTDECGQTLFMIPLPLPFGASLLCEPVVWKIPNEETNKLLLESLLKELIVRNKPQCIVDAMPLNFDVPVPYTHDTTSDDSSTDDVSDACHTTSDDGEEFDDAEDEIESDTDD